MISNYWKYYPAKNINKNHEPGTANTRIASSVCLSPISLKGMQSRIKTLDIKNIALAGSFGCNTYYFEIFYTSSDSLIEIEH